MLLALDMGNTNITLGVFQGEKLLFVSRMATDQHKMEDEYAVALQRILHLYGVDGASFKGAIISSVVPSLDRVLRHAVARVTGCTPLIVGPGIKTGVDIRIDNPAQLGADLLVGAVAAVSRYGTPCLVWDLGTATKVSVINDKRQFLGCVISPGIGVSMEGLCSSASLLPRIRLEAPPHVVGSNTVDAMQSGIVFGTACMLDGMSERIMEELGSEAAVVITGGLGREVASHCRCRHVYDDNLLLEGLRLLYEKNAVG